MNARGYLIQALNDFECTQDVLAGLIGVPRSTLARWLRRQADVPHHRMLVLALASVYYMRGNLERANELWSAKVEQPDKFITTLDRNRIVEHLREIEPEDVYGERIEEVEG